MIFLLALLSYLGFLLMRAERVRAIARTQAGISAIYFKIEESFGKGNGGIGTEIFMRDHIQRTLWSYMNDPISISYLRIFSRIRDKQHKERVGKFLYEINSLPDPQKKLAIEALVMTGWGTIRNHAPLAIAFWSFVCFAFVSTLCAKGVRSLMESWSRLFKDFELRLGAESIGQIACL